MRQKDRMMAILSGNIATREHLMLTPHLGFLTPRELRASLRISRTMLHRYVLARMPHLGHGRLRRLSSVEILHWLAQHPSLVLVPGRYRCRSCGITGDSGATGADRRNQLYELSE
jgi:hypothetical protein